MPKLSFKKVFLFLDTEKHASPFDILTTIDIFPEAQVIKYEDVTVEDVESIVHDAIFPRGPEGAKHTKIFLNGHDIKKVNAVLDRIKKCMFPPFELAVIVDPRGAYTTAAAAVAKTLELPIDKGFGSLENKEATILAGTGPVGQTAARLYVTEKVSVTLTSRSLEKASSLAAQINDEYQTDKVHGVEANTPEEIGKAIENAEMILAAGAAGTQLLSLDVLRKYAKKCRIVADINAVPPPGIESLEPDADGKQILPNVSGTGALIIGKMKNKIEAELITKAAQESKGIFDCQTAFEIGKRLVLKKPETKKTPKAEPPKQWLP